MAGRPGDRVDASGVWFQLLGPVEIRRDGATVPLRGPQPRCVLAMLLLDRGHVVCVDRLLDALWADEPPRDARNLLQQHVSRIRRALSGVPGVELATVGRQGYRLDVAPESVDLYRFRSLVKKARATDDARAAADLLGQALGMWRGDPLGGVAGDLLAQRMVPVLEDELLSATEAQVAARLRLGQHEDVVSQLSVLISEQPLRESVAVLLMEALQACGRTEEALAVFRDLRGRMVDELGIEPSEATQDVHQAILDGRLPGADDARDVTVVPAQLPADVAVFVGRRNEVKQVRAELEDRVTTPNVVVVAGPPGTGKSALAVHVGHLVRSRFPDGQLYAYLAGTRPDPLDPGEVLGGFLHALGMPSDRIPGPTAQRSAAYRSLLADRQVLVVLDDAKDAAQVRPLLPASEGCAVLVSSRSALTALDATARVSVGMLDHADSVALLAAEVDPGRLHADPGAVEEVVRACGNLPIALRVVGRRLAVRPQWSVRTLAEQLADERERLDELAVGDLDVRTTIGLTYQRLDPPTARAFRLLGLVDGPDIGLTEAGALLDLPRRQAGRRLDLLVDAHLVECRDVDRYRMHDLLRAYAQERVAEEDPEGRVAALGRLAASYALGLRNANHARAPGLTLASFESPIEVAAETFTEPDDATAWLHRERPNIVAAIRAACAAGAISAVLAGRVAGAFSRYADAYGHLGDISAITEAAAELSRAQGDAVAEGLAQVSLGVVTMRRQGRAACVPHFRRAAELLRGTATRDEASALNNLAICTELPDEGLDSLQRAYDVYRALGDERGMTTALGNIADHHHRHGNHERAVEIAWRAAARAAELEAPDLATLNQVTVVEASHALGRTDEVWALAQETCERAASLGVGFLAALAATAYARMLRDAGRPADAVDRYEQAVTALRGAGARHDLATTTLELGDVLHALGQPQRAEACWTTGLEILEDLGAPEASAARERLECHRPGAALTRL